jgi:hypothetical protein
MPQAYSNPDDANNPHRLPDVEYWHGRIVVLHCADCGDSETVEYVRVESADNETCPTCGKTCPSEVTTRKGWAWWTCSPGCMPDSEPSGPFDTEAACIADFTIESDDSEDDIEPCEGDYTLTPTGHLGGRNAVGIVGGHFLQNFTEEADARRFIRERMDREHYWPNVWSVSDHGNWTLTNVRED